MYQVPQHDLKEKADQKVLQRLSDNVFETAMGMLAHFCFVEEIGWQKIFDFTKN